MSPPADDGRRVFDSLADWAAAGGLVAAAAAAARWKDLYGFFRGSGGRREDDTVRVIREALAPLIGAIDRNTTTLGTHAETLRGISAQNQEILRAQSHLLGRVEGLK
jgi:hypothetical protein